MRARDVVAALTVGELDDLSDDLREHGAAAIGATLAEVVALVGTTDRATRLRAWLRVHGVAVPRPPRPRTERAPPPVVDLGRTHVVFGDAHAAPGQDLSRFVDMGRIVRAEMDRADEVVLVQIGDWYSFDSLCDHETLKKRAVERVTEDIAAGEAALEAFHRGLGSPAIPDGLEAHLTLGNHDVRIDRLAESAPWLDGIYGVGAAHDARGWHVHPYRTPARIDGVRYQHDLPGRGGGRAIGGVNAPRALLARVHHHESVVVGHSHVLQYVTERSHVGRRVHAVVVGAWLDHVEDYAGPDNESWWVGHVVMRGVVDGDPRGGVEFHPRTRAKEVP